jgi:hypothetical protein
MLFDAVFETLSGVVQSTTVWQSKGGDRRQRRVTPLGRFRPQLLALEERLPPGDVLLGGWLAGLPLEASGAADNPGWAAEEGAAALTVGRGTGQQVLSPRPDAGGTRAEFLAVPPCPEQPAQAPVALAGTSPRGSGTPAPARASASDLDGAFLAAAAAAAGRFTRGASSLAAAAPGGASRCTPGGSTPQNADRLTPAPAGWPRGAGRTQGRDEPTCPRQEWAATYDGSDSFGNAMTVDAEGNVYVTGATCVAIDYDKKGFCLTSSSNWSRSLST